MFLGEQRGDEKQQCQQGMNENYRFEATLTERFLL